MCQRICWRRRYHVATTTYNTRYTGDDDYWRWWRHYTCLQTSVVSKWSFVGCLSVTCRSLSFIGFEVRDTAVRHQTHYCEWRLVVCSPSTRFTSAGAVEFLRQTRPVMWCCSAEQTALEGCWWNWRQTSLMLMLLQMMLSTVMDVVALPRHPHRNYSFPDIRQGNRLQIYIHLLPFTFTCK